MKKKTLVILGLIAIFLLPSCASKLHSKMQNGVLVYEDTESGKHAISGSAAYTSSQLMEFQKNNNIALLYKKHKELVIVGNYDEADRILLIIKEMEVIEGETKNIPSRHTDGGPTRKYKGPGRWPK